MSITSSVPSPGDILIVDDTSDNTNFLSHVLTEEGYKVRAVATGHQALVAAQLCPPDLILLDINLPDMDGFEVCIRLKADQNLAAIPVIFLSNLADAEDKLKVFSLGGVDYITKPFQIAEVLARVGTHFKLYRFQLNLEKRNRNHDAYHEAVLNNIADGVLILDSDRNLLSANPALLHMIPQKYLKEIISQPLENTIRWKRKTFSVTTAIVPDVGTVAVFRDETRRYEVERARDALLATISHELRTPLTAAMNYIEMLIVLTNMGKVNTDSFIEYLNRALENSQRLHNLVLDVLDIARIQAGRMVSENQLLNLSETFEQVNRLLIPLAEQKELSFELIVHPNVPNVIRGDSMRFRQVLLNLVGNAIKFTEQGGVKIVAYCDGAETLKIQVADTGPGISPEQLPDIFEPFRSGSDYAHRKHQGAGLGLALVKQILLQMNGDISASSEVGIGSVFTIIIPIENKIELE